MATWNKPRESSMVCNPILIVACIAFLSFQPHLLAQETTQQVQPEGKAVRVGMIGLDTSHAPAFAKLINSSDEEMSDRKSDLARLEVVAAYPGGSKDLSTSRDRVAGFTEQLRGMGIEIVDSIDDLLPKVDAVLLESVDGRKHLEQVLPVFRAGKPVFIDKPLAHNLSDALAIQLLADKYQARWFSSSSLRFSPSIYRYRTDPARIGSVQGAVAWSPCSLEPTHDDLTWYGIHGVETLFTAMGTGCQSVVRTHADGADVVTGIWKGGRIGTFRGLREGKGGYGLVVFGEKQIELDARFEGYAPLVDQIATFFLGGAAPVENRETIEIFAFMAAAQLSKQNGGSPVQLKEVIAIALESAQQKVAAIED